MTYTLGTAAAAAGVSKTTLRRAIQSGRLSTISCDDGSYEIDPAERTGRSQVTVIGLSFWRDPSLPTAPGSYG